VAPIVAKIFLNQPNSLSKDDLELLLRVSFGAYKYTSQALEFFGQAAAENGLPSTNTVPWFLPSFLPSLDLP
jgi:hypothetical protein